MSIYKSIAKNYATGGIGMIINFCNQILMVPLFILYWGVGKYADWIIITAFSSIFTMINVGFNTVTMNEFVIKYQQREFFVCSKLLINTSIFILLVASCVILLSIGIANVIGFKILLSISFFSEKETSVIFILLLFQIFAKMYSSIYEGVFRATAHTHISIMIDNTVRFAEILILFLGILCNVNIIILIIIYIIPVCIGGLVKNYYIKKWFELSFSLKLFDFQLLKSMLGPSFAFMLMPIGYALSNQGMIFIIKLLLGPVILVTYTTTRTMVNFLRSLMGLLATAIWPEISAAFGRKDNKTISKVYCRSLILTLLSSALCIIVLFFVGKPIYLFWTKHAIVFDPLFFDSMLLLLFVTCLWSIASVIPLATNNHSAFTITFLFTQLAAVGISYVALYIYPHLQIVPFVLLVFDSILLWFVLRNNGKLLNIRFNKMLKTLSLEANWMLNKLLTLIDKNR